MTTLILNRLFETPNTTVGTLYVNDKFFCYTIERSWKENERNISCIPKGIYEINIRQTGDRGRHLILNTAHIGRGYILIHSGNTWQDTHGCILPNYEISLNSITEPKGATSKKATADLNKIIFDLIDEKKEKITIKII